MEALKLRDKAWEKTDRIPEWVRGREISLDQFNTMPKVAEYCWNSFQKILKKEKVTLSNYNIIEPSAGTGSFYDLLPENNRIGVDVEKYRDEFFQSDFLTWEPEIGDKPCLAIGNPPFGYRGWLALAFLNRAAEYCDYVGFILPMSFQSDGKGSPKNRVKGMKLIHSERLPSDLFVMPDGEVKQVNTLWQVWKKGDAPKLPDLSMCDEFIELFTVDLRKERLCGMKKIDDCDFFLQRSYFTKPPEFVSSFDDVRYGCGYGVIFKKKRGEIKKILKKINWDNYSNLATHNCRHISMYHIRLALLDNGLHYV